METLEDRIRLLMGRLAFVRDGFEPFKVQWPGIKYSQEKIEDIRLSLKQIADELRDSKGESTK